MMMGKDKIEKQSNAHSLVPNVGTKISKWMYNQSSV